MKRKPMHPTALARLYTGDKQRLAAFKQTMRQRLYRAVKKGEIEKASTCEICGDSESNLVGHHWCGHSYWWIVWWVCPSCNSRMHGDKYHSGKLTKDDVRQQLQAQLAAVIANN